MKLSETRFVKIDGVHVTAQVNSAVEAKVAVKELRHKKREYAHLKRTLARALKKAEADAARSRRKPKRNPTVLDKVRGFFDALRGAAGALQRASAQQDVQLIERELKQTSDIAHNLDTVLLQVEGKLLHLS